MALRFACLSRGVCCVLGGWLLSLSVSLTPAAADGWPAAVRALYQIDFNGFNVGTFEFQSQAESESYTLAANARLSILPPAAAATVPIIPVREHHLKGVVDPLSAIMMLSRAASSDPCDRRIPIFDGKERFDLLLSRKGEMRVTEQAPSGQPDVAYVCRVRYLPIAGHKIDSETKFMAANDAIEVALRPVPSANVFVPYQINIPTMAGSATITSKRVEIASPGKPQIAMLY